MRLIDADALWKQMEEYDDYMGSKGAHDLNVIHRDSILFAIEQAPTVDAVPVSYIYKRAMELKNDDMMYAYTVLNSLIANYRADGERKDGKK